MLLLFFACRVAEVVDWCDENPCLACEGDAECGFTGNACVETVYCAHDDEQIAVIEIGCSEATEYAWPSDDACACVDGACRSGD
ncbi:MAG: hypothetical protein ACOZNI_10845 [Myxococcota bacterium]